MSIETTPKYITSEIIEMCTNLTPYNAPAYVLVKPIQGALSNDCFNNVSKMVKSYGGKAVNGWVIWQWANVMLDAEAHCIWQSPENDVIDITPHNYGEDTILFLADENVVYRGNIISSQRLALTKSPTVAELIKLQNAKDEIFLSSQSKFVELPMAMVLRINELIGQIKRSVGRNDLCSCNSGLKYKNCCGRYE